MARSSSSQDALPLLLMTTQEKTTCLSCPRASTGDFRRALSPASEEMPRYHRGALFGQVFLHIPAGESKYKPNTPPVAAGSQNSQPRASDYTGHGQLEGVSYSWKAGYRCDSEAALCPPQRLPSLGTRLQSQLLFVSWWQPAPGRTQGCTGKGRRELGAPAEAHPLRISKSVFVVGWTSGPRNLHWSAPVIWKRDTSEAATFTKNINYTRVETRTRTEHFRFVWGQAAGQRQSLGSIRSKADSTLPTPRTRQTLTCSHPGRHHVSWNHHPDAKL